MEDLENSGHCDEALEAMMMELAMTMEEIEQAGETAIRSWLQSAPLIDALEKQQIILSRTKKQVTMASTVIASLGSLLETTTKNAEEKQHDDGKNKIAIEEMSQAREWHQQEIERLRADIEEEKGEERELKAELRVRRQSLKTTQLKRRAVSMELEAFNSSLAITLDQVSNLQKVEHEMVGLSHEEFYWLQKEADKEVTLATWRVAALEEKMHVAEASRDKALKRLETLYKEKKMKESMIAMETSEKGEDVEDFRTTQIEDTTRSRTSQEHQNPDRRRFRVFERRRKVRRNKNIHRNKPNSLQKILKFLCSGI